MKSVQTDDYDLNLLKVLDAVLASGSNRTAAKRLDVSESAVSHALNRLRKRFNDPLVVPRAGRMHATPFAESIAPAVRRALAELGSLAKNPSVEPRLAQRAFTVASADLAELVLLPELTRALVREAPGIDLRVLPPPPDPFVELEAGRVDVAWGVFRDVPAGFRRQVLGSGRFVCVVRRGHPALRSRLTLPRWLEQEHIVISPMGGAWTFVDEALGRKKLKRRIRVRVPHFLLAAMLVAETDLLAMLPDRVAQHTADAWGLSVIAPPIELEQYQLSQVWHERTQADPMHAWFRRLTAARAA